MVVFIFVSFSRYLADRDLKYCKLSNADVIYITDLTWLFAGCEPS